MADLLSRLPLIRRARGYRLYDLQGRRYLDLWQNGGRALLGHRPGRLTTVLKNTVSKGLIFDLPSVYLRRLERALQGLFPDYRDFRLFASEEAALEMISLLLGRKVVPEQVVDPLFPGEGRPHQGRPEGGVVLWRPLLAGQPQEQVLIPLLPFAMGEAPVVVCFRRELPKHVPGSLPLSPVLLAGLLRCLHDLQRHELPGWLGAQLLRDCPGWRREGIYLVPEFDLDRYETVFLGFLAGGAILNPRAPYVSILPTDELSKGELGKMVGLFHCFPGK